MLERASKAKEHQGIAIVIREHGFDRWENEHSTLNPVGVRGLVAMRVVSCWVAAPGVLVCR